ncbi:MAG: UDP-N-acetylmuramoyl-L-alanine--D-glutamate ligase [Bacteroidetes bacterium]|nr:UDP-N-acetylmuramoyl-L-alanine--D-glutamate ligase [Bacteroidota bacterium]MBU1720986.1 UDP-N-acetylmuramoyl-L-alanine--D-glutamate ligase [Bacteroidota bacterium]
MQSKFLDILDRLKDRNILIAGFGREGYSTYRLLRNAFPDKWLSISDHDLALHEKISALAPDSKIHIYSGPDCLSNIAGFDLVIKTPGISFRKHGVDIPDEKVSSQAAMFTEAFRDQIIGITGTKGKSTTTCLTYHLLRQEFPDTVLVGNIGIPPFDKVDEIGPATRIVFEYSSHQLENISVAPACAIFLNLFPEHLDHYGTFDRYAQAKLNIIRLQQKNDVLIFNEDEESVSPYVLPFLSERKTFRFSMSQELKDGLFLRNGKVYLSVDGNENLMLPSAEMRQIRGDHNLGNIMAAIHAALQSGINPQFLSTGVSSFKGLPHRMEFIGIHRDISYYNDSIATIPEASMRAIQTITETRTLIAGGFDRGIDYRPFAEYMNTTQLTNVILMGDAGEKIAGFLCANHGKINIHSVNSIHEAVVLAASITPAGHAVVLSPAAASYGMFKNFEERGDAFRKCVKDLP